MRKILCCSILAALVVVSCKTKQPEPPKPAAQAPAAPQVKRIEDIIYGRKFGTALTMDAFRPTKPNGYAVVVLVSGGWYSGHDGVAMVKDNFLRPLVDHGYTVFAVVHGSQPKFTIPEIEQDIHRAIRFIRYNATKYQINPNKIGITGGSAGGHLTLTMVTKGKPGDPNAKDPVDRESSAVQCGACFFPPTDFLNYGQPGEDAVGVGTLKDYKGAFGPRSDTPEERQKYGREISPIYFIRQDQPPALIIHGDADKLVPIYQAQQFVKRSQEAGATAQLIVRPGKAHGWPNSNQDVAIFADWFDQHLRGLKPGEADKTPSK